LVISSPRKKVAALYQKTMLFRSDLPPEYLLIEGVRIQTGCDWKQNIASMGDILY
jgi:hypothetical protein